MSLQFDESNVETRAMKRISMLISVGLALLLSGCATASGRDYTTQWASSAPEFLRLDNGMTVRYVSSGDGPPLVLFHTIRTQLDYFEKLVPELTGHYRVYALDLPGHGRSSLQPENYTEPLLRKAVSEFITKLDLRDVTLVGESIGGVLALTVSVDQPERVKRVVSLNPYDYGESFGGGIRRSSNGWMVGMFNVFGNHTLEPRFVTAAVLRGGFHDATRLPQDLLDEFSQTGSRDGYRSVEFSVFKNWTTWLEARKLYRHVKVPVTLVYGSEDWSRPEERARNREAISGSHLFTIDRAGHFTSLEKPAEVATLILGGRAN
jgi:pimeloyl-ACP methyl ester carboxylesterase